MKALAPAAALALGSCATPAPLPVAPDGVTFDPIAFFAARAEGTGTVHKLFSRAEPLHVRSRASPNSNRDTLALVQTISEGAKPARRRFWIMKRIAPGRFEGTLAPDAIGPVTMVVRGPRALIRYRMTGGLEVRQQLALQARTDTLCNRLEIFKFGVRVAWVGEKIERSGWMPLVHDDSHDPPVVQCPGA